MARRLKLNFTLDVVMVPMPEGHVEAWRAGILLLLNILKDESLICAQGDLLAEVHYATVDSDRDGDDGGVRSALLPIQAVVEG